MTRKAAVPRHEPGDLLKERQVAEILGVDPSTLRNWRYARTGPQWIKLGAGESGAVRYPRVDLEAYIAERRQLTPEVRS